MHVDAYAHVQRRSEDRGGLASVDLHAMYAMYAHAMYACNVHARESR